jgi:hypothetical protein
MLCIVGVALGGGGAFVLGISDAVVEEQVVTLAQPSEHLLDVLAPGDLFCCLWCSHEPGGMMVLSSVDRAIGLGVNVGALVFVVGLLDMESIAYMFFTEVITGGVKFSL